MVWHVGRDGAGYATFFVWASARPPRVSTTPLLARSALDELTAFVVANGIAVELNPDSPWRDRTGVWHGEMLDFDPAESIRSIRKAAVGPWTVQVYPRGGDFLAITKWTKDGRVVREGQLHATLADAVADGLAQVTLAQQEAELLP